jgi:hypothetical protein
MVKIVSTRSRYTAAEITSAGDFQKLETRRRIAFSREAIDIA